MGGCISLFRSFTGNTDRQMGHRIQAIVAEKHDTKKFAPALRLASLKRLAAQALVGTPSQKFERKAVTYGAAGEKEMTVAGGHSSELGQFGALSGVPDLNVCNPIGGIEEPDASGGFGRQTVGLD